MGSWSRDTGVLPRDVASTWMVRVQLSVGEGGPKFKTNSIGFLPHDTTSSKIRLNKILPVQTKYQKN